MAKGNILVVEDEKIIAKDLEVRLSKLGYQITGSVTDGKKALQVVNSCQPDLILMDIRLTGEWDGIYTAQKIREMYDIPVVYLTACADDKVFERAQQSAPFAYVLKPFRDRELDITLQTVLDRHALEKMTRQSQQALRKSNAMQDFFFSQSLDGVFYMELEQPVQWDSLTSGPEVIEYAFCHQRITRTNQALLDQYDAAQEQFIGKSFADWYKHDPERGKQVLQELFDKKSIYAEAQEKKLDGTTLWIKANYVCTYDEEGRITGHFGMQRDITQEKRSEQVVKDQNDILAKIARNEPLTDVLNELCQRIERLSAGAICSILEVKSDQTVHLLAAPGLPMAYNDALEGVAIGPEVGSCGTAAFTKQTVIVSDIAQDPLWKNFKDLALNFGLRACWSSPVLNRHGQVTATFALYYTIIKQPSAFELELIRVASSLVGIAVERELHLREMEYQRRAQSKSEQRFRLLAENSPDIIYTFDGIQQRIMYVNREEVFGYRVADELTTPRFFFFAVHDDSKPALRELINAIWLPFSPDSAEIEYRVRRKDGKLEWVSGRYTVIDRSEEGVPVLILINLTIITEKREAQEALEKSRSNLLALIENTNDMIWAVNPNLELIAANSVFNQSVKNTLGYDIALGCHVLDNLPEEEACRWSELYKKALKGNRFSEEHTHFFLGKQSNSEVSFNPIHGESGNIEGVTCFSRDITKRKQSENELIRTNFELDSFVYRASHDLRAPLRSILGLVNIAKVETDEAQRNIYLELVERSVNKLDTFISDLTNFSRNTRTATNIQVVNLDHIIRESSENLMYMDNAKRISIRTNIRQKSDFYSDETRMGIIFQNLISNAIKYMRLDIEDPSLLIEFDNDEQQAILVLSDNGRGIRAEYLERIFDMFFRASSDSYGSGLGLYITKQVIEKLHGKIVDVRSKPGEGTTFTICLPNLSHEAIKTSADSSVSAIS